MNLQIYSLEHKKEFIDIVTKWRLEEWGKDTTFEYIKYHITHSSQKGRVPMTFVALLNDEPVGTVAIWTNDLPARQDLYPWLASLFVVEEHRNKGIGQKLQQKVIDTLIELQYKEVFLYTDHINYYERFGWEFVELAPKRNGEIIRIYRKCI